MEVVLNTKEKWNLKQSTTRKNAEKQSCVLVPPFPEKQKKPGIDVVLQNC